jgi:hypothetical protein
VDDEAGIDADEEEEEEDAVELGEAVEEEGADDTG